MKPYASERGAALLMVVLVVMLLTAVIVDFSFRTRLDSRLAANVRDSTIAAALARSGYEMALLLLVDDAEGGGGDSGPIENSANPAVSEILRQKRLEAAGGAKEAIDSLQEAWANMNLLEVPLRPNQSLKVEVIDQAGRINLNAVIQRTRAGVEKLNRPVFEQLVTLIGQAIEEPGGGGSIAAEEMSAEDIAYAIADWVDTDEIRLTDGSFEDQYYNSLEQAYSSKNGPFDSVAELQLVEGVNDEVYAAIRDSVTVYPFEGGGEINVNTAPESVIRSIRFRENQAIASPEPLSEDSVNRILEARDEGIGIANIEELRELLGLDAAAVITPTPVFASNYFKIVASSRVDKSEARLEAVVQRGESLPMVLYWRLE